MFLILCISLRLVGLNFYVCDAFFLTKKRVQKGVYRNDGLFLLLDRIESAPDGSHKNENISGASRIESAPDGSLLHYYDLMVKMDERV